MLEETKEPIADTTPEPVKDPLAEARALVQIEEVKAQKAYVDEINAVGKKHGYNIQARADLIVVKA